MAVSVEVLEGLERKLTVSIPSEKIESEVNARLKEYARTARIDGYRKGKARPDDIRKRFSKGIRQEVLKELIQPTLFEALQEQSITPAGYPLVEPVETPEGEDFVYTAKFEVYPEIKLKDLNKETKLELVSGEVTEKDVDETLQKLQSERKEWAEVEREAKLHDKVDIDFTGYIDNEPFEGGKASHHELELGSGKMIPGFEDALIGHKKGETFDIHVTFPVDYHHDKFKGKSARFEITLHKVLEGQLPALDEKFAESFDVKEGGMEALRRDIMKNMNRDLSRRVSSMNRERIFDAFMKANSILLPKALVDREIEELKHELYHRIFGAHHHDNEKIPDFPRSLFEKKAMRRVHLGLLFSEFVKQHELNPNDAEVDAFIENMSEAYDNPEEIKQEYRNSKERRADVQALVLEEMVADKIAEHATVSKREHTYYEILNLKSEHDAEMMDEEE